MTSLDRNISFIGFGEAAQAFVTGLSQENTPLNVSAFDIKTDGPMADAMASQYQALNVHGCANSAKACTEADIIFSLVTAEQAEIAANHAAGDPLKGALFLDCNSCAPNTKRRSAEKIEAAGGRYVDVAVMTPVHPKLHKSPCLIAGPHAADAQAEMIKLGMSAEIAGDEIGQASTKKMIRSIMVKGLEALTLECFLAARKAGIETDILASLDTSYPGFDWPSRAPYMMERAATHGIRRAAEMDEVAKTLRDLDIQPLMTKGTVARQREVGTLGLNLSAEDAQDLAAISDVILNGLKPETTKTQKET